MDISEQNTGSVVFIGICLVILVIAVYIYIGDNTCNIFNDTTFVGEVVVKEAVSFRTMPFTPGLTTITKHRLYVIGNYFIDGEKVKVDRIITVSAEIFNRYEIGDIISPDTCGDVYQICDTCGQKLMCLFLGHIKTPSIIWDRRFITSLTFAKVDLLSFE